MEENFGYKAMEIARRFYLNPTHHGSLEFAKGGYLRLKHRNLGLVQGITVGFEKGSVGNEHCFHLNLADGENFKISLNNYGFYSVEGSEDKLGLLLLSTATEREEIDFSTVRVQNTFPEHGVFSILNYSHQEFMEMLEDLREIDYAWIIDREPVKALFQLHDAVLIQFTMCNPSTGEFDADLYYRHLTDDFNVNIVDLTDQLHWSGF